MVSTRFSAGAASLLAIDTATEQMAIAACHFTHDMPAGQRRESTVNMAGGASASATMIDAALAQLRSVGLSPTDLHAVAFGAGPGAFTGLRSACAVAQGMAFGAGIGVLPIDSLLIVAEDARHQAHPQATVLDVWVAMDARMGEVYAAAYRWEAGVWAVIHAPVLCDPLSVMAFGALGAGTDSGAAPQDLVAAGNAAAVHPALRQALADRGLPCIDDVQDRAGALLRLACAALTAGAVVDPALALPVYLRDKVALTTLERETRVVEGAAR